MAVRPPKRLVVVGSILVDVLLYIPHLPERGGDVLAHHALISAGGGFNVLYAAKRLGLPAAYAGLIGDGPFGRILKGTLARHQIPCLLPYVRGADNGFDVALVEADGERSFVTAPGCESRLTERHLRSLHLAADDACYVSGYDLLYPVSGPTLARLLPRLTPRPLIVFDPGPLVSAIPADRLLPLVAASDVLTLNRREGELMTGHTEPSQMAASLRERIRSDGVVLVRAGEEGTWLADADRLAHLPTRPARVVDTTGAGDTHTGAFLASLAEGWDVQTAVWRANIAASLSVELAGPATAPDADRLAEECARLGGGPPAPP